MHPDIVALSIATRPDCLNDDVLELLDELNQIKPVWIELGLQTIHPKTAAFIRRGYDYKCFTDAVEKLHQLHIPVITHLILGLPGEDRTMILESVKADLQTSCVRCKIAAFTCFKRDRFSRLLSTYRFSCFFYGRICGTCDRLLRIPFAGYCNTPADR